MAAIAAVLNRRSGLPESVVSTMLHEVPHRGSQVSIARSGKCTLGIAQGEGPHPATLAQDGDWMAAIAGAPDNLAEVQRELPNLGRPSDSSGADVLLAAFRVFGEGAASRMRGVYSAVVTDGTRLWAFKDHIGFEPLFYRADPQAVFVASEAKQIVKGAAINREPNMDVIEATYFGEFDEEQPIPLRGVYRVPKTAVLVADAVGLGFPRYWEPERLLETARLTDEEVRLGFGERMQQAVSRALDARNVISLSGGIDSPTLAAFAAPEHLKLFDKPLPALSKIFPDYPSSDEEKYIQEVADFLGLPLQSYQPVPWRLQLLGDWARLFDGPWPLWSPQSAEEYYRHASELGFRTILSGELAEFVMDQPDHLVRHLLRRGRLGGASRYLAGQLAMGLSREYVARQLLGSFAPRRLMAWYRSGHPTFEAPPWLDRKRIADRDRMQTLTGKRSWPEEQLGFLKGPSTIMEAGSILQARSGVRVRMPWADVDLWEFFLGLPASVKHPGGPRKSLVRKLLNGRLPDSIVLRRSKTLINEFVMKEIDYPSLSLWLSSGDYRMPGVDYETLQQRVDQREVGVVEFAWVLDLVTIHAFLDGW